MNQWILYNVYLCKKKKKMNWFPLRGERERDHSRFYCDDKKIFQYVWKTVNRTAESSLYRVFVWQRTFWSNFWKQQVFGPMLPCNRRDSTTWIPPCRIETICFSLSLLPVWKGSGWLFQRRIFLLQIKHTYTHVNQNDNCVRWIWQLSSATGRGEGGPAANASITVGAHKNLSPFASALTDTHAQTSQA